MKRWMYRCLKRFFDIFFACFGIVVTLPIWLIVGIGIYISDPGPIFYVAQRVGKDNQVFSMYKFRSMRQGIANESVFRGEEERIFPLGKIIRATKIDELPQLLCCINGRMSLIGPRPAAKDQMNLTRSSQYGEVAAVRPGLSGPAAIYDYLYGDRIADEEVYRREVLPKRMALELYYVRNRSFIQDIKYTWDTIVCIVCSLFRKVPRRMLDKLTRNADEIIKDYTHDPA